MKKTLFAFVITAVLVLSCLCCAQADSQWIDKLQASPHYAVTEVDGRLCVVIDQYPVYRAVMNALGRYSINPEQRLLIPLEALEKIDDLSIYDETDSGTVVDLTILGVMPGLESLNLDFPSEDYSPIAACTALKSLYIHLMQNAGGTNAAVLGNTDFSFASGLKKLENLSISIYRATHADAFGEVILPELRGYGTLTDFSFSLESSIYGEEEQQISIQLDLSPIAASSLKSCSLWFNKIDTDVDLSPLADCAALEELSFYSYGVNTVASSSGWGELAGLKKLNDLTISSAEGGDVLALLQGKSKIKKLEMRDMAFSSELAKAFPAGLTELDLVGLEAEEDAFAALPKMQKLKRLMIGSCTHLDLSFLPRLSACTELELNELMPETDLSPVGSMKALSKVYLSADQFSEPGDLSWLAKAKWRSKARELRLLGYEVSDLSFLSKFTGLTWLVLEGPVTDLKPLSKLTNLKLLNLLESRVEDVTPLGKLTKLEDLSLSGSFVSDVKPLAKCKNLQYLAVDGTRVTDLTPLAKNKSLRRVTVSDYCRNIPEHMNATVNEWAEWPTGESGAPMDSTAEEMLSLSGDNVRADRAFAPFMGVQLKLENGMYTLYSAEDGSVIIPPKPAQYVTYEPFGNGETVVRYFFPVLEGGEGDLYSYAYRLDGTPVELNRRANLPIEWDRETRLDILLDETGAAVASAEDIEYIGHDLYVLRTYREHQSCSVVDKTGRVILPETGGGSVQLCEIDGGWILLVEYDEPRMFNYLKMDGTWMFEEPVEEAGVFSEGVAPVKLPGNDRMGYIDPDGNEVIPAQYMGAKPFSEGVALVVNADWSRSYIDHDGVSVFEMELSTSSSFRSGHAIISTGRGLSGMMNREGVITMEPQWPELDIHRFEYDAGDTPCVMVYEHSEETGITFEWYLDFSGNIIAGGQRRPVGWQGLTPEDAERNLSGQNGSFYGDDLVSVPLWGE